MAHLCLLAEDGSMSQAWELGDHPVSVGRDDSADVVVEDDTLSRKHFRIVRQGEKYLVEDLSSQNGTFVDGQPARATPLQHHNCILAGRTLFLYSEQGARPRV